MLHENIPAEVEDFRPFFPGGSLYLDGDRRFFGPTERRMLLTGFLRADVYAQIFRTKQKNVPGNLKGDGTLLGGVFVLGPASEVLYEHREGAFGDHCDIAEVLNAVEKLEKSK